ncbi:MAG: recombinase family protein, partial [Clostridia bacterium]
MNNKTFGYARVSTKEQNLDRQVEELKKYGIDERDIFLDKESGKDFNREAYQRLVNHSIRAGDIIVIKSIDRLGRNYEQILEQWRKITKELDVDIVVLDMPLLNTAKNKDLMGTLISDIVLQLLSFVSQKEREHIKQRQ